MKSDAFLRLVEVPFQGQALKFIVREDFIAMKVFAGGEPLDLELVRRLAKKYGRDAAESLDRLLAG